MRIVIAYHPNDALAKDKLKTLLKPLELDIWDESQLKAGDYTDEEIENKFSRADCVLFLMSADSLADEPLLRLVSGLHFKKTARIVPIILRECLWEDSAFATLQPLPADKRPLIADSVENAGPRLGSMAREIKQLLTGARQLADDLPPLSRSVSKKLPEHPYIGLTWFTRTDAPVFFGRNKEIKDILDLIGKREAPILALYGASGVGKSSLLEAGIRPRLEEQYFITYQRREKSVGYAQILQRELDTPSPDHRTRLVILDQAEEMFTDENPAIPDEKERFFQLLNKSIDTRPDWFFILGFRKEYFTDLKKWVYDNEMEWHTFSVEPLDRDGILEAISGVTLLPRLREKYALTIDDNLPYAIAADILKDKAAHMAPLLQILLRKMWDAVAADELNRRFTPELYDQFRVSSLDALLSMQLETLKTDFPEALRSGLALDLLHFFTTESLTAAQWTEADVLDAYAHIPDILRLKGALKKVYLLAEAEDQRYTRLSHDAMARLVVQHYDRSELEGPKATRLLRYAAGMKSTLTREAMFQVLDSRKWRRKFDEDEEKVYRSSLLEHYQSMARLLIAENLIEHALHILRTVIALDIADTEKLDTLNEKETLLLAVRSELNSGTISYLDYQQKITAAKMELLRWIDSNEQEKQITEFNELLRSFLNDNLEISCVKMLAFAEKLGNKKILDEANALYTQQVEISRDERNSIISWNELWLLKSRTIAQASIILSQLAAELQGDTQPGLLAVFLSEYLPQWMFEGAPDNLSEKLTTALLQNPDQRYVQYLFRWTTLVHQVRQMHDKAMLSNSEAMIIGQRLKTALFCLLEQMQVLTWDELETDNLPSFTLEGWRRQWEALEQTPEINSGAFLQSISANELWKAAVGLEIHFQSSRQADNLDIIHKTTDRHLSNGLEWYLLAVSQEDFVRQSTRYIQTLIELTLDSLPIGPAQNRRPLGPDDYKSIFINAMNDRTNDLMAAIQTVFTQYTLDREIWQFLAMVSNRMSHNKMLYDNALISPDDYIRGYNRSLHQLLELCQQRGALRLAPGDFTNSRAYLLPDQPAVEWSAALQNAVQLADDDRLDEALALMTEGMCRPEQNKYLFDFALIYARHQHTSGLSKKGMVLSSDLLILKRQNSTALMNFCERLSPRVIPPQPDIPNEEMPLYDHSLSGQSVEKLIAEGNLEFALIALQNMAAERGGQLSNEILSLQQRFYSLRLASERRILSHPELMVARQRITMAALEYYDQLKQQ